MKRVPLRRISAKQQEKQALWNRITDECAEDLRFVCEWCLKRGHRDKGWHEDWYYLDGHHKVKRSEGRIDTPENCYLIHRICHGEVEENNVDVRVYKTRYAWLNKDSLKEAQHE